MYLRCSAACVFVRHITHKKYCEHNRYRQQKTELRMGSFLDTTESHQIDLKYFVPIRLTGTEYLKMFEIPRYLKE